MIFDAQDNPLAGATIAGRDLFDRGCLDFARFTGDPVALFDAALAEAPGCTMAVLAKAWCLMLATEPAANRAAAALVAGIPDHGLDERCAGHKAGLLAATAGNWRVAAHLLERHNAAFPRDLIGLQAGHMLDFLCADARTLRDRIARALPKWDAVPGQSLVQGMLAFGLEESGAYGEAEAMGCCALDRDPGDVWAHHAVAHVMEMQGRAAEGLAWSQLREPHWAAEDNFLKVHNWWHRALCHIELADPAGALDVFDHRLAQVSSAQDLIDASALLWRLDLSGFALGDRWDGIATAWQAHADANLSAFNNLHAGMAWLGAGRDGLVDDQLACTEQAGGSEAADWIAKIGRPLVLGFEAFRKARYDEAVHLLWPARRIYGQFGGSHAQRDVIDWTLTEAAVRGRIGGLAEALVNERLARRPHSPINLAMQARVASAKVPEAV